MSYQQTGHHQPDYSTLEVDDRTQAQALPEVYRQPDDLPEVYDQSLPEVDAYQQHKYDHVTTAKYPGGFVAGTPQAATATAFSPGSPYAATATTGNSPHNEGLIAANESNEKQGGGKRICGLKKKTFIIVLVAAIIVVIAIVAGVAGGVVSSQSSDDSSTASPDSTSPPSPEATEDPTALSPGSQIAATSYTDGAGYTNHLVFYQLNNRQIHMATYNSSASKWNVNPVVDGNSGASLDDVAAGTPLAADIWADATISSSVWHLYWLSPTNVIMSLKLNLPSTENPPSPDDWIIAPANGYNIASPGSQLGSYARACDAPYCSQYSYLWWQKSDRSIDGIYLPPGGSWTDGGSASDVLTPAATRSPGGNSSISVANVRANADEGDWRALAIFYRGEDGGLGMINYERKSPEGLYYDGGRVGTGSQGRVVGEDTTILAFSTGTNGTQKGDDPLGFQVLTNDPDKQGEGIMLTYYRNGEWGDGGEVQDLSDCKASNSMAVSQVDTGRDMVWCMVKGSDGKMQIRYFTWSGGATAKISEFATYQDMGLVTIT